jgi:hypothetical protein
MMISFHGKQEVKDFYVKRMEQHAKADEIIKGQYWEDGKGCAVGCTIHSSDHAVYQTELGLPEWLAILEDKLFEMQCNSDAKIFAVEFLQAIPVGVNLEPVKWQFCAFLLRENIDRVLNLDISSSLKEKVTTAIRQALACCEAAIARVEWNEAAESARSARSAAESAESAESARSAAWSAWSAWSAAWSAAESARSARSARSAAESARSAAWSAWSAAWSARSAARSAAESARSAAYKRYADHLLILLRNAQ